MSTIKANTIQPLSDSASVVVRTNAQDSLTVDSSGNITVRNEAVIEGINIGLGGQSTSSNLRFGRDALSGSGDGSLNTALGHQTLDVNNGGSSNTAVGYQALFANTTGARNVGVGVLSSGIVNTGSDNTAVGWGSGNLLGSDSQNTCIGSGAAAASNVANSIAIGYNASAATNNSVYLGNANTTSLYMGNGTAVAPAFVGRAWVTFRGTHTSAGVGEATPTNTDRYILASGNVTKVTRVAIGTYDVYFTTAMPTAHYVPFVTTIDGGNIVGTVTATSWTTTTAHTSSGTANKTASVLRINITDTALAGQTNYDLFEIYVGVFC